MSDATVSGVIHLIEETKTFGNKGFRKRLVVLEQDKGSFTNYIPVEFLRDSCDSVDELNVGDEIEVSVLRVLGNSLASSIEILKMSCFKQLETT